MGNVVVPFGKYQFDYNRNFTDGLMIVYDDNGSMGYIDTAGNLVVPFGLYQYNHIGYDPCQSFNENLAWVQRNGLWGILQISSGQATTAAPTITGSPSMSLPTGYTTTASALFVVSGNPTPDVTVVGNPAITWNATGSSLDIAPGLPEGAYTVTLTASNGIPPDASYTFTLTVGNSVTPAPTQSVTPTPVVIPTMTPTPVVIPTMTPTPIVIPSASVTPIPSPTASVTPTPIIYPVYYGGNYYATSPANPPTYPQQTLTPTPTPTPAPTIIPQPGMTVVLTIDNKTYSKNGVPSQFDIAPYIDASTNRTMVPIRFIAEAFGASVSWNDSEQTDYIYLNNNTPLKITVDQPLPNDMGTALLVNDRLFVPVRYVSEQLGMKVDWNAVAQTVTITE